ncbi:MAG: AMP-binding protein [Spirochaetes bacterium]|nr:AMP-binding protein [Spirochaetota bacterium]
MKTVNITARIREMARSMPHRRAVVYPVRRDRRGRMAYAHITFGELERMGDACARGFTRAGIGRGVATIVMVKPGVEFFGIMLGLLRAGAVPVLVDPGMGVRRMLHCLGETGARAFVGIPAAHILRVLAPGFFKSVEIAVTVGKRFFWGGHSLAGLMKGGTEPFPIADTKKDELAMIAFTTGSTGPAKGVEFTWGMMEAQVRSLGSAYGVGPDDIGLHTFPAFALFDGCLGATTVIPDMDPTKPAKVDPAKIIEPIRDHGVTYMFGSPALVGRVGSYGRARGIRLPSLKRVITAGAPVHPHVVEDFTAMMEGDGDIYTPYGATEALPIASISGREILEETSSLSRKGRGNCVGRPVEGIDVHIITINDGSIPRWSRGIEVPAGEIGEIAVSGPQVSRRYHNRLDADALAKIRRGSDIVHRMGDLGWKDKKGRIWMCGRMKHRVRTAHGELYSVPCEAIFNNHPEVFRSALVGIGDGKIRRPAICVELVSRASWFKKKKIRRELLDLAITSDLTREIEIILFHPKFPVDVRHNAKIFREKLTTWANRKV